MAESLLTHTHAQQMVSLGRNELKAAHKLEEKRAWYKTLIADETG